MTLLAPVAGPGIHRVWGLRSSGPDPQWAWLPRALRRLEPVLARGAQLVVVNSEAGAADALRRGFPRRTLRVVPNGIDTDTFRPEPQAGSAFRRQLGIPTEATLVGRVGRLIPLKGYPDFLRAAALVRSKRPEVRFLCVGDGDMEARRGLHDLQHELELDGCVSWIDAQNDMTKVYNGLDVFVSSSTGVEGFPNVLAEAMACCVPCVATDVGDSAFVVGDGGIVVSPRRPGELMRAILDVLDDLQNRPDRLGRLARARVVANFSQTHLASQTLELLEPAYDQT